VRQRLDLARERLEVVVELAGRDRAEALMISLTPSLRASLTSLGSSAWPTVTYVETVLTFLPAFFWRAERVDAGLSWYTPTLTQAMAGAAVTNRAPRARQTERVVRFTSSPPG
jgi:hypothetical protein